MSEYGGGYSSDEFEWEGDDGFDEPVTRNTPACTVSTNLTSARERTSYANGGERRVLFVLTHSVARHNPSGPC